MPAPPTPEAVREDLRRIGLPCPGLPELEPLPGDAGARRYVRVRSPGPAVMLMLVPESGDSERGSAAECGELPYLNVQRYLKGIGMPVPEVYGWDPETGRLYHEDFGSTHLSAVGAPGLYNEAMSLVAGMQQRSSSGGDCVAFRRRFDREAIRSELAEFAEAGLSHTTASQALEAELDALARDVAALPVSFSHRDYHGDNLLFRQGDDPLGMIDFQDAFLAPRLYDVASLLTDRGAMASLAPYVEWATTRYFPDASGILPADVEREFWLCALQRQMKVAGRFVNLERKGKTGYARHLPATWAVIAEALRRTGRTRLKDLIASLGGPV